MTNNKKSKSWTRFVAVAAALALVLGLGFGLNGFQKTSAVTSTVSLDVNPSVELKLNSQERVLEVIAKNEDGRTILDGMDLVGSDVEVAVNALIGSMVRNGYLSELANSILVSVESQNAEESAALQSRLMEKVNQLLTTGAVLSQTVEGSEALKALAQEHNISVGKAQLIQKILSQNSRYTFADLAKLSINELNLLTVAGGHKLEGVNTSGSASEKQYIGKDAARDAALTHAGLTVDAVQKLVIEMDLENGKMVYEVEFDTDEFEYEYDIDAVDGTVAKFEKEPASKKPDNSADPNGSGTPADPNSSGTISREDAKAAALTHAGLTAESISDYECELDRDDGVQIYEISFDANGYEYEYDINAKTGKVLSWEREAKRGGNSTGSSTGSSATERDDAIAAALKHAGLTRDSVRDLECELDKENGKSIYEISFQNGSTEYEYEIDAATGAVLRFEKEIDD